MTGHRLVILSAPLPGQDDAFERWYDDVHLRDIASVEGVLSARRMRILDIQTRAPAVPAWRSVAIYDFGPNAPQEVIGRIGALRAGGGMEVSPALDRDGVIKMIVADTRFFSSDR